MEIKNLNFRLSVEMGEVRSYRLGDDGNTVTLLMKDGTTHNTLIFLDEGTTITFFGIKLCKCTIPLSYPLYVTKTMHFFYFLSVYTIQL